MKRVLKYDIEKLYGFNNMIMPYGAEILCAKEQFGRVCLWVLCDDTVQTIQTRTIEVFTTGQIIEGITGFARLYIDTVLLQEGEFVVHIFERVEK